MFGRWSGRAAVIRALMALALGLCVGAPLALAERAPQIAWTGSHGTNQVRAVAFSRDSSRLASGDLRGTVRIWGAPSGALAGVLTNTDGAILNLWFRRDGTLMSWAQPGILKKWRLSDQTVVISWTFASLIADYSEQGELFAGRPSTSNERTLSVWRLGNATPVFTLGFGGYPSFSPDGSELAVAYSFKERYVVELYRTSDWSLRLTLTEHEPPSMAGASALYSPDGSLLMVRGFSVYSSELWRMPAGEYYGGIRDPWDTGHPRFMLFSPDGKLIVTANRNVMRFWLVEPGLNFTPFLIYDQGFSEVQSMAISPDGKLIALGLADGRVLVVRMPVIIQSARQEGNGLRLEWTGPTGPYEVQHRETLTAGEWQNLGAPLNDPTTTLPLSAGRGFFRVVGLP